MSFKRLIISVGVDGSKAVSWQMERGFRPATPTLFYVDRARTGGEFSQIGGPVTDACVFVDSARFSFGTEKDTWYRARYKDATNTWVNSVPTQAINGQWSRQDWLRAKEVLRREYVNTAGAIWGMLLKRKTWGTVCTRCGDWSTSEPTDGLCPVCLGSGIVGGFYPPIPMVVGMDANQNVGRKMTDNGLVSATDRIIRFAAYQFVSTGDVWCQNNSDDRYLVNEDVTVLCEVKGVPIIMRARIKQLPKTDVMHGPEANALLAVVPTQPVDGTGNCYTWYDKMSCERY